MFKIDKLFLGKSKKKGVPCWAIFGLKEGNLYSLPGRYNSLGSARVALQIFDASNVAWHPYSVPLATLDFIIFDGKTEEIVEFREKADLPGFYEVIKPRLQEEEVVSNNLSAKYPKYWKPVPKGWTEVDVYRVCTLFPVSDDSGRINHARKKLLVPGVRTGGKSMQKDVQEAIDTLQAWLNDNPEKTDE